MSITRHDMEYHLREKEYLVGLCYIYLPQFAKDLLEILLHIDCSYRFIDALHESSGNTRLNQRWLEKGVFEGFPATYSLGNINSVRGLFSFMLSTSREWEEKTKYLPWEHTTLASLIKMSSLINLLISASPQNTINTIGSLIRHSHIRTLNLMKKILAEAVKEAQEGLILFIDIDKTTPKAIEAEKNRKLAEHNVQAQHLFSQIGNVISMEEGNTRSWLLGGDSFLSVSMPSGSSKTDEVVFKIILELQHVLKKIEQEERISFLGGAHWGKLLTAGDKVYLNLDFIKAVRAQEFCKKAGKIVITRDVKEEIERNIPLGYFFTPPDILIEGKHAWMKTQKVSIQFGEEQTKLFVMERRGKKR